MSDIDASTPPLSRIATLEAFTVLEELAKGVYRDPETGDCSLCDGPATRTPKHDTPFGYLYGNTHEPTCLWVRAHQILNTPLPDGHTIKDQP